MNSKFSILVVVAIMFVLFAFTVNAQINCNEFNNEQNCNENNPPCVWYNNACYEDTDMDNIPNIYDNCPEMSNSYNYRIYDFKDLSNKKAYYGHLTSTQPLPSTVTIPGETEFLSENVCLDTEIILAGMSLSNTQGISQANSQQTSNYKKYEKRNCAPQINTLNNKENSKENINLENNLESSQISLQHLEESCHYEEYYCLIAKEDESCDDYDCYGHAITDFEASGLPLYNMQKFEFTIDEDIEDINYINIYWSGSYFSPMADATVFMYIWNGNYWEYVAGHNTLGQDTELSFTIEDGIDRCIDENKKVYVLIVTNYYQGFAELLVTDYVSLKVGLHDYYQIDSDNDGVGDECELCNVNDKEDCWLNEYCYWIDWEYNPLTQQDGYCIPYCRRKYYDKNNGWDQEGCDQDPECWFTQNSVCDYFFGCPSMNDEVYNFGSYFCTNQQFCYVDGTYRCKTNCSYFDEDEILCKKNGCIWNSTGCFARPETDICNELSKAECISSEKSIGNCYWDYEQEYYTGQGACYPNCDYYYYGDSEGCYDNPECYPYDGGEYCGLLDCPYIYYIDYTCPTEKGCYYDDITDSCYTNCFYFQDEYWCEKFSCEWNSSNEFCQFPEVQEGICNLLNETECNLRQKIYGDCYFYSSLWNPLTAEYGSCVPNCLYITDSEKCDSTPECFSYYNWCYLYTECGDIWDETSCTSKPECYFDQQTLKCFTNCNYFNGLGEGNEMWCKKAGCWWHNGTCEEMIVCNALSEQDCTSREDCIWTNKYNPITKQYGYCKVNCEAMQDPGKCLGDYDNAMGISENQFDCEWDSCTETCKEAVPCEQKNVLECIAADYRCQYIPELGCIPDCNYGMRTLSLENISLDNVQAQSQTPDFWCLKAGCEWNYDFNFCYSDVTCNLLSGYACNNFVRECGWYSNTFNPLTGQLGYCLPHCSWYNQNPEACEQDPECYWSHLEIPFGQVSTQQLGQCKNFIGCYNIEPVDCFDRDECYYDEEESRCLPNCDYYNEIQDEQAYLWCEKAGCKWDENNQECEELEFGLCNYLNETECMNNYYFYGDCYWYSQYWNPLTFDYGYCRPYCQGITDSEECNENKECYWDSINGYCSDFSNCENNFGTNYDFCVGTKPQCFWDENIGWCQTNCSYFRNETWCEKAGCAWYGSYCTDMQVCNALTSTQCNYRTDCYWDSREYNPITGRYGYCKVKCDLFDGNPDGCIGFPYLPPWGNTLDCIYDYDQNKCIGYVECEERPTELCSVIGPESLESNYLKNSYLETQQLGDCVLYDNFCTPDCSMYGMGPTSIEPQGVPPSQTNAEFWCKKAGCLWVEHNDEIPYYTCEYDCGYHALWTESYCSCEDGWQNLNEEESDGCEYFEKLIYDGEANLDNQTTNKIGDPNYLELEINVTQSININLTIIYYVGYNPVNDSMGRGELGIFVNITANPELPPGTSILIKVYYDEETLNKSGLTPRSLKLYFYNQATRSWSVCSKSGVNTDEKYVWCITNHLSIWGIAGSISGGGGGGGGGGTGYCGDKICGLTENCVTCQIDCGECPDVCGDGKCGFYEGCFFCPQDCGACPRTGPRCGDGKCDQGETCENCVRDCGNCVKEEVTTPTKEEQPPAKITEEKEKTTTTKKVIIGFGGAIVILVVIVVLALLLTLHKKKGGSGRRSHIHHFLKKNV